MKITLVDIYPHETVARYLLSGYFLKAYLDKYCQGCDVDTEVINFSEKVRIDDLADKLLAADTDIIGYSCYIWNIEKILKVIEKIKKVNANIKHILGGPEISLKRISSISTSSLADFYVIGEGEKKLLNLIKYIQTKGNRPEIIPPNGIAYWKEKELKYYDAGCNDNVADLNEIPSIYLNNTIDENLYKRQQVFMETQRGCRFKCKYCVYHKFLPSIKYYSKERVTAELDHLITDCQVTALRITDAIFTSDLKRAKEIVKYLVAIKEKPQVRLPWIYWEFDYNSVDEEFIKLVSLLKYKEKILNTDELKPLDRPQLYSDMLKDYTVINSIGVESFCDKALIAVGRRKVNLEKFDSFMQLANKYNIVVKMDMILALPFETLDDYFKGLEIIAPYLKGADHILNMHRLQILPGSELEELTDEYKLSYSRSAPHIVYSTNVLSEADLNLGVKLTALFSRIINSPLRSLFFRSWENSGKNLRTLIDEIYGKICASKELVNARLVCDDTLYDSYWNDDIYRQIPATFIEGLLKSY